MRERFQNITEFRIPPKTLRAFEKPKIELAWPHWQAGNQFGVKTFGVVHQKAGMNLKEAREKFAGALRQVWTRTVFNLRKIRLAEPPADFVAGGTNNFRLRHFASKAAQHALGASKIADFVAELHIFALFHIAM
ncbi:MAG TPA: hypothetical protein VGR36_07250 [Candidatus Acidoferrales bacterium]|nr:hypothetical protein [Candidatus Acidoferrales bacterium]